MGDYFEEIWDRAEAQFTSKDKMLTWLNSFERPERGATDYTKDALEVRDDLSYSEVIERDIKKVKSVDELNDLISDANEIRISSIKDELLGSINERLIEFDKEKEEKLKKKGKLTTIYRGQIKDASNENEIKRILSKAEKDLGEGKNYDSLVEASEIMITKIEEEKEENIRRQEEARIAREIAFEEIERTGGGKNPDF